MPTSNPSHFARRLTAAVLLCALAVAPVALGDASATPVALAPTASTSHHHAPVNPHLHSASVARQQESTEKTAVHRARWHRWYVSAWYRAHKGTATIEGTVRNGEGKAVVGALVRLRSARGKPLHNWAAKHVTSSGSGGNFTMVHVRAGHYRVRADRGGHSGHTGVAVHRWQTLVVGVKI